MISQQVVEGTAGPRARIITDPHDFAVAEPIECRLVKGHGIWGRDGIQRLRKKRR